MLLNPADPSAVISPAEEIAVYEAIWACHGTFPKLAKLFRRYDHALPLGAIRVVDGSAILDHLDSMTHGSH